MSEEICRTRRLARQCGYENSVSVCQAIDQAANEVAQEKEKQIEALRTQLDAANTALADGVKGFQEMQKAYTEALVSLGGVAVKESHNYLTLTQVKKERDDIAQRYLEAVQRLEHAHAERCQQRDDARAQGEMWRSKVVWCFSEEEIPVYIQGKAGENEICSELTADEANGMMKNIVALREALREARPYLTTGRAFQQHEDETKLCQCIDALLAGG